MNSVLDNSEDICVVLVAPRGGGIVEFAAVDEHVADKDSRLHVIVGLVTASVEDLMSVVAIRKDYNTCRIIRCCFYRSWRILCYSI